MAVTETIALRDKVSAPARRAASSLEALQRATKNVQSSLVKTPKDAVREMKAEHRAIDKLRAMAKKREAEAAKGFRAQQTHRKQVGVMDKKIGLGVAALGTALVAFGAMGVRAIANVASEFTNAVTSAHSLRSAAQGTMNVLTAGRGGQALEQVDKLALQLGQSLDAGRAQFIKFRDAGKSIGESAAIMKLRADIEAATGSAERADEAISAVLSAKSGDATAKAMAKLAKETGVAGDGVAAATKRLETFDGFVKRIKDAPARIFDALAKSAGTSLDDIGKKANKALNEFLASDEAHSAMKGLVSGVQAVTSAVGKAIPLIMPFLRGFSAGMKPIVSALAPIAAAIGRAFGGDSTDAMKKAEAAGKAVAAVLTTLALVAAAVAAPFVLAAMPIAAIVVGLGKLAAAAGRMAASMGEIPAGISSALSLAKAAFDVFVDHGRGAAANLISSIVSTITGGLGRVIAAAKQLGGSIKSALFGALGIKSPSKVGSYAIDMIGAGVEKGAPAAERAAGSAAAGVGAAMAGGVMSAPAQVSAAGGGSGGGGGVTINLSVSAQPGATPRDGAALAEGIIPVIRREFESLMGGRMLEAT